MAQSPTRRTAAAAYRSLGVKVWRIATAAFCIVALALWSWKLKGDKQDGYEGVESVLAQRRMVGRFSSLQDVSTLRIDDEVR